MIRLGKTRFGRFANGGAAACLLDAFGERYFDQKKISWSSWLE